MTTTSYDHVTVANETGSGQAWTGESTFTTSTSGLASASAFPSQSYKTLNLSIPDFMSGLDDGIEFVSMDVKFRAYVDVVWSGEYFYFEARQDGATTYQLDVLSTDSSFYTVSGDQSFWGFTGSVYQIIDDLADGTINWRFRSIQSSSGSGSRDIQSFQLRLTYAVSDNTNGLLLAVS